MPLSDTTASALGRAGWLAGLPALALLWAAATYWAAPGIAARIEAEGAEVVAGTGTETGEPWLRVEARGRDLVARGEAPDVAERESALAQLAALDAPRRVVSELGVVETAVPFVWSATRTGPASVALEGNRPAEVGRRALEVQVTGALATGTRLDDTARAARGAPPDFPGAAVYLAARLSGLARGGRATLSDTVLSLSGEALDLPAYDALRAALAQPPDGFSIGRVEVVPPRIADYRIALERVPGGIVLEGFAPSEATRAAANATAAKLAEGGFVDDRLRTARGLPDGVDTTGLVAFLGRLAELIQAGRVTYADGAVSVSGDAIDPEAIPEAQALLRDGRPAGVAAGTVSLAARPLSPYRVAIRRTAEGVTVSGHLPDAGARERVLAALRPRLFREPVVDRTRIADGAPDGLGAALAAAAPLLTNLAAGEIAVSDRSLRLTGESLYPEAAARTPEKLAALLPAGWAGTAAVAPRRPEERRDLAACQADFTAATAAADLRFPAGSVTLAPGFYPTLDALAALAKACPSLRIAISGPADPAKPPPAATAPGPGDPSKAAPAKTAEAKPDAKAAPAKPAGAANKPKPAAKADAGKKPDETETPADLPRQRSLALVEYLLQAGARPDQVAPGPDGAPGRVAFALLP